MHLNRLLAILIFLNTGFKGFAQAENQFVFSYLGKRDGLVSENIESVAQDDRGFMWIATFSALQRYDGKRFLTFTHRKNQPASLPDAGIRAIGMGKNNRMWMVYNGIQAGYFHTEKHNYVPANINLNDLAKERLESGLFIDNQKNPYLVVLGKAILGYDEKGNSFNEKSAPFILPARWRPNHLYQDASDNFWICTDSGLVKFNPQTRKASYRGNNSDNDPYIAAFSSMKRISFFFIDRFGRAWASAWDDNIQVIRSHDVRTGFEKDWQHEIGRSVGGDYYEMYGVTELGDSTLWFTGQNLYAYLNEFSQQPVSIQSNLPGQFSIRYDKVGMLYEDREKNIWITTNKGLYRFNPASQISKTIGIRRPGSKDPFKVDVTDFLEAENGSFYVSTWGHGLFAYDKNLQPIEDDVTRQSQQKKEGMAWCMMRRANGDIWRGLQHGGLMIYRKKTNTTDFLNLPVFSKSTIRQIIEDKFGNIWLGTQNGSLVKFTAANESFNVVHRLGGLVSRLYEDKQGFIWICTDRDGVRRLNPASDSLDRYYVRNSNGTGIRDNGAADIVQYNDSLMVIASGGLNFLSLNTNRLWYLGTDNFLPTNQIINLAVDDSNRLWMVSDVGVISYNYLKRMMSWYMIDEGVPSSTYSIASSIRFKDGRMAFGTVENFVVFDPADMSVSGYTPPEVAISEFHLLAEPLHVDSLKSLDKILLGPDENSLTISLSTLTYNSSFDIYYQLEGLDKEWKKVPKTNQIVYNYLPPGNYIFKAACKDETGKFGKITTLNIHVASPFYRTWWFISLVGLLISAILFLIDRQRQARLRKVQAMRSGIGQSLAEEVNNTLQNIHVLSEIAGIKSDTQPTQSKDYIQEIKIKSRYMVTAMNDVLWSIDPHNDSMEKTLNRIQEFTQEISAKSERIVNVSMDAGMGKLKIDMKKRMEFLMIYKAAITNLVEILKAEETDVQIDYVKKMLQLRIFSTAANYNRINPALSANNEEMKTRAASAGAVLDIQSDGNRTAILLSMKI